ncbi:MAG: hypothetical protein HY736_22855 [Verrucomicrobia bacterium]|nr:hypothetical protein [Verrucomicrobiota bacterium]
MDKPWKVIFAFVGVFIAGAVFGGLFTLRAAGKRFVYSPAPGRPNLQVPRPGGPPPGQAPPQFPGQPPGQSKGQLKGQPPGQPQNAIGPAMMRQFTERLRLTEEQRGKIRPIVARAAEDLQRLRRENLQDTTRVMERMHLDIGGWLKPDQRNELEEMKRAMQERVSAERQKRGDVPPGDGNPRANQGRPNQGPQNQGPRNQGPPGQPPSNQPRPENP